MGEKTGISWTNSTWNPWVGCHKVSAGCRECYMFREQKRYGADPNVVRRTAPTTFNAPLKWKKPGFVFTCSWSDFFIEEADEWRADAWAVIEKTPHLTYQILTKRPERIRSCLPYQWSNGGWPRNVWLGISAENQEQYDLRWPILENASVDFWFDVVFVSLEPLLGEIELAAPIGWLDATKHKPDWVIVGGESGPESGARPMKLDWARAVRDQCAEQGIPFFFKQIGGRHKTDGVWGSDWLDGKQHHEFPEQVMI